MFGFSYSSSTSPPRPTQGCLQPLLSTDSCCPLQAATVCTQQQLKATLGWRRRPPPSTSKRTKQEAAVAVHSQRQSVSQSQEPSLIDATFKE
uniref:Uncharacterized protein n=1 Tax=Trichuris muris TaxID=70415 RepID=A0A5S6QW40_TRIMR